ncbi:LysR family transcriptional regulator [Chryseobacterium sp. HR92]|uniref:LysR family transcriptional regulator n=1 Tax=Chryseobacterium sp. HR92 TaxID=3094839 RepID=UPI00388E0B25|nr:LysR family transcriptional regulator [Chryseobacterium sp. HR92]
MNLQQIKYFLAVARELHFWNAAATMNITQSALSRQIQSLETLIGVQLFERNKRNVKLTPAGQFLKEKWEVELNKLESFHKHAIQIQLGESGTITIAHPDSISASIMPDIISKIMVSFPKINIELVQVRYEDQQDFLRNYKVDLVITRDINNVENIISEKIYTDHLAIVVPENHAFKNENDINKASLESQRFILPVKDEGSSYSNILQQLFNSFNFIPNVCVYSEFGSATIALVRKGLGIAILPDSYIHHANPGIRFISMPIETNLYLNWRSEDQNPILTNVLRLLIATGQS